MIEPQERDLEVRSKLCQRFNMTSFKNANESWNNISHFIINERVNFSKLEILDLSNNHLETMTAQTLRNLMVPLEKVGQRMMMTTTSVLDNSYDVDNKTAYHIPVVLLHDNPWTCDCNLMELIIFFNETREMFRLGQYLNALKTVFKITDLIKF